MKRLLVLALILAGCNWGQPEQEAGWMAASIARSAWPLEPPIYVPVGEGKLTTGHPFIEIRDQRKEATFYNLKLGKDGQFSMQVCPGYGFRGKVAATKVHKLAARVEAERVWQWPSETDLGSDAEGGRILWIQHAGVRHPIHAIHHLGRSADVCAPRFRAIWDELMQLVPPPSHAQQQAMLDYLSRAEEIRQRAEQVQGEESLASLGTVKIPKVPAGMDIDTLLRRIPQDTEMILVRSQPRLLGGASEEGDSLAEFNGGDLELDYRFAVTAYQKLDAGIKKSGCQYMVLRAGAKQSLLQSFVQADGGRIYYQYGKDPSNQGDRFLAFPGKDLAICASDVEALKKALAALTQKASGWPEALATPLGRVARDRRYWGVRKFNPALSDQVWQNKPGVRGAAPAYVCASWTPDRKPLQVELLDCTAATLAKVNERAQELRLNYRKTGPTILTGISSASVLESEKAELMLFMLGIKITY